MRSDSWKRPIGAEAGIVNEHVDRESLSLDLGGKGGGCLGLAEIGNKDFASCSPLQFFGKGVHGLDGACGQDAV